MIEYAILGCLRARGMSGYDLKKLFAESPVLYWSGNSNQIYTALARLHREGRVRLEVEQPESGPARKVYYLTETGRAALREWLLAEPELPELKQPFHVQMAWAGELEPGEVEARLEQYAQEVDVQARMERERQRRGAVLPVTDPREQVIWQALLDSRARFFEAEAEWARELAAQLSEV